jgi:hypothetical protein
MALHSSDGPASAVTMRTSHAVRPPTRVRDFQAKVRDHARTLPPRENERARSCSGPAVPRDADVRSRALSCALVPLPTADMWRLTVLVWCCPVTWQVSAEVEAAAVDAVASRPRTASQEEEAQAEAADAPPACNDYTLDMKAERFGDCKVRRCGSNEGDPMTPQCRAHELWLRPPAALTSYG